MRRSHDEPADRAPWWFSSIFSYYVLPVLASVTIYFLTQRGCGSMPNPELSQQDTAREQREVDLLASRLKEREQQLARLERERDEQQRLERERKREQEESQRERLERERRREEEERERERKREIKERLDQQQRQKEAMERALDELAAKIKALETPSPPTAKKPEPHRDLTGVWRTTGASANRSLIRECVFGPTGRVSSLDYLPGMKWRAKAPIVGTYSYSNDTLVVEFALGGGRRLKETSQITWRSDSVIESQRSDSAVILVWTRE